MNVFLLAGGRHAPRIRFNLLPHSAASPTQLLSFQPCRYNKRCLRMFPYWPLFGQPPLPTATCAVQRRLPQLAQSQTPLKHKLLVKVRMIMEATPCGYAVTINTWSSIWAEGAHPVYLTTMRYIRSIHRATAYFGNIWTVRYIAIVSFKQNVHQMCCNSSKFISNYTYSLLSIYIFSVKCIIQTFQPTPLYSSLLYSTHM